MLFTGATGEQYGYRDGWEPDGTFRYTGEGQVGDMAFVRGNAAIRDHAAAGKDLHLFRIVGTGVVEYEGPMVCASYELVPGIPDRNGTPRMAIVFRLVRAAALAHDDLDPGDATLAAPEDAVPVAGLWAQPLAQIREVALHPPPAGLTSAASRRNVYRRSEAVRVYVLRRANGVCEGCGQPAPFVTPAGRPYLEPHHVRRLADGGPDHPAWVIALCPTCHRRAHHGADAEEFNAGLTAKANAAEIGS